MTTHRKSTRRTTAQPVALRVNGKAVSHGDGAKLAAAAIGCTQTTGSQVGQGNVRAMLEYIGAGECLVQMTALDDPVRMREIAIKIAAMSDCGDLAVEEMLQATAAALRSAARLREQAQSC